MTGTLDTLTNLELQCLGLWTLLWTSSGNDRDSGILVLTSQTCPDPEGGQGARTPLENHTSYMRFYGNKHLDPPWKKLNPPEKCWTPLQNCKIS